MKKVLLSILALFVVVGSASAVPSPDERKIMCEKRDGWVWVEETGACIEENPCESDHIDIQNAYCNRTFKDVSLFFDGELDYLLKAYLLRHDYGWGTCAPLQGFVRKYYKCVMKNSYVVFEALGKRPNYQTVEDFNNYAKDGWTYVLQDICDLSLDGHYDWNKGVCKGLTSQQCVDAANVFEPWRRNGYIELYYSDSSDSCVMK